MSLLHPGPARKAGKGKKKTKSPKDTMQRKSRLPARRYLAAHASDTSRVKRAGLLAPKGRSPKAIRDARMRKKIPQKKASVKKKDLRLFEMNMLLTPLEFLVKLIFTLATESGFSFKDAETTDAWFTKAVESVPDDRHHAILKIQAGPKNFHCRIWFVDPRTRADDSILLEFEEALQADCGLEIRYYNVDYVENSLERDARLIVDTFGAYVLARARLALPTKEIRDKLPHLVREAKQLMRPVVG